MVQKAEYMKGCTERCDYKPGSDVAAGDVVVDGDVLLICTGGNKSDGSIGISANKLGSMVCRGGIFLVKADGAIAVHKRVYWDATAGKISLTRGANLQFGFTQNVAASADGDMIPCEFAPGRGDIAASTVAATGSTQGDAAALSDGFNVVTAGDGTKGVVLPAPTAGRVVYVKNGAAAILKVYPPSGKVINALSADAAISLAANVAPIFISDGTKWYTIPLLPS